MTQVREDYLLLSADPGSHFTGLAVSNLTEEKMIVLDTQSLELAKLSALRELKFDDARVQRLYELEMAVERYAKAWRPCDVISEAPYYGDSVTTYAALTEAVTYIQHGVWRYSHRVTVKRIDPPSAKKSVGVSGKSGDKSLIREALLKLPDLAFSEDIDYYRLSEHVLDAVAVGYYYYKTIFKESS